MPPYSSGPDPHQPAWKPLCVARLSPVGRDKSSISTTYTQDGHLKKVTDPTSNVTVTAGYYLDGRVRTVDDGANANTYAYDASGQVTVRTDQTPAAGLTGGSKLTTSYGYNQAGLPGSMASDVLDQNTSYAYDVAGRLESAVTGSHRVDWGWYPDNSVAHVRNADGATTFGDFVYHYFDSRNIRQQVVTGAGGAHTDSYTYLAGDQVSSWTNGTATTTYKYDANANRTEARLGTGVPTEWAYHRDNSIASVKSGTDTKAYSYNNAGLLTSDGCSTTSYDDFDRVAKVEVSLLQSQDQTCGSPDKRTTTYSYDGLDRQRSSAVTGSDDSGTPNVTTKSIFDGLSTTTVGQSDAVSGNRSAAEVIYQLDAAGAAFGYEQTGGSPADGHKAFLDTDGQGNVTNIVTLAGGNACTVHYDPFGSGVDATSGTSSNGLCKTGSKATTTGNAVWYRGSVRDGSVGTYQFGTRTYNPASGAFTTPDSYRVAAPSTDLSVVTDPLTMNTYTYVNGNPVNAWDPTGHAECSKNPFTWGDCVKEAAEETKEKVEEAWDATTDATGDALEATGDTLMDLWDATTGAADDLTDSGAFKILLFDKSACEDASGGCLVEVLMALPSPAKLGKVFKIGEALADGANEADKVRDVGNVVEAGSEAPLKPKPAGARQGNGGSGRGKPDSSSSGAHSCQIGGPRSFSGDTLVLMGDGTLKPIKDIRVDDYVMATDPETGEQAAKKVTRLWVHLDDLTDLMLANGERITTTEDHPFWNAADQVFEDIEAFDAGDMILTDQWERIEVTGLDPGTTHRGWAYNLTVDDIHTYHVGTDQVLVHNTCGGSTPRESADAASPMGGVYSLRDDAGNVVRTGRTKNLGARETAHANDPVLGNYRFSVEHRTDIYAEQRGLEQMLYDMYPGARAANGGFNKIRGISPSNPNLGFYTRSAWAFLGRIGRG